MDALLVAPAEALDEGLTLLLGPAVLALLASRAEVERRRSDVDVAVLDKGAHVSEEEGQDQRGDVATVHVGIGHDDDLVVAQLGEVERLAILLGADGDA